MGVTISSLSSAGTSVPVCVMLEVSVLTGEIAVATWSEETMLVEAFADVDARGGEALTL